MNLNVDEINFIKFVGTRFFKYNEVDSEIYNQLYSKNLVKRYWGIGDGLCRLINDAAYLAVQFELSNIISNIKILKSRR